MRAWTWVAVFLVAMIGGLAPAGAEDAAGSGRTLIVGVEDLDYRPAYGWHDGLFDGAAAVILDSFAADRGYRLVYRPLPVKRLFAAELSGEIDLKFPDNPIWATDVKAGHTVLYSQPMIGYVDGVLVTRDHMGAPIARLGTVTGFTPSLDWRNRIRAGTVGLSENPDLDSLLRQVQAGRIDGAFANVVVALQRANVLFGPEALAFDSSQPFQRDSYRLSSVTRGAVIAEFDAWITANAKRVADIKRHFGTETGVE